MSDESYLIRLTPAQRDILFALVNRAPLDGFARGIVKMMAEEAARKEGVEEITPSFMRKVRQQLGDR